MWRVLAVLLFAAAAQAQVTSGIWSPCTTLPADGLSSTNWQANDEMDCVDWVPAVSITSATSMHIGTGGSFSTTCGLAIYNSTGGTVIRAATGTCSNAFGEASFLSLTAFSLTAGTAYRTCWCAKTSSGAIYAGMAASDTMASTINAFVNHIGVAANPCVNGVTPTTTGAITPTALVPIAIWVSKE